MNGSKYSGYNQEWRDALKLDNSKSTLDGQRTIRLLEIACYADVMCHSIEYPLRVATSTTFESNLETEGCTRCIEMDSRILQERLPLDAPGDDTDNSEECW